MPMILGLAAASAEPVMVSARVASGTDASTAAIWADWRGTDEPLYWRDGTGKNNNTNLRFAGLQIPRGATITEAYITVYAEGPRTGSNSDDYVTIGAEQADNSASITDLPNHVSRMTNLGTTVQWPTPNMVANQAIVSPNLAALVQQVVNRGGWPNGTGGAIQFFAQNNAAANANWNNANVAMQSYLSNTGATYIPLIEITYLP